MAGDAGFDDDMAKGIGRAAGGTGHAAGGYHAAGVPGKGAPRPGPASRQGPEAAWTSPAGGSAGFGRMPLGRGNAGFGQRVGATGSGGVARGFGQSPSREDGGARGQFRDRIARDLTHGGDSKRAAGT